MSVGRRIWQDSGRSPEARWRIANWKMVFGVVDPSLRLLLAITLSDAGFLPCKNHGNFQAGSECKKPREFTAFYALSTQKSPTRIHEEPFLKSAPPSAARCSKPGRVVSLHQNLRSDRRSKQKPFLTTVLDEPAQALHVCQQILEAREAGALLKSQAVLFRASSHSAQLEIELARCNIPFVGRA